MAGEIFRARGGQGEKEVGEEKWGEEEEREFGGGGVGGAGQLGPRSPIS